MFTSQKAIRSVFVGFPYSFGPKYRDALAKRFAETGIEIRYADDKLLNVHVMEKIRRMMSDADVSFFDVTESNPNVMFELGYALGKEEPAFIVVQQDFVNSLSADIAGWDQLRYDDFDDLAEKVHHHITSKRVPLRKHPQAFERAKPDVQEVLRSRRFGIPAVTDALLMVYAVPEEYDRYYKQRDVLGNPPYRARDLCSVIDFAINTTQYRTFFWGNGYSYDFKPGPDFVELFDSGAKDQTDRETNFRLYTSGMATYMQRLRSGGADMKPFLYNYMFEEVFEMACVAIHTARQNWDFSGQGKLHVGTVFLHASDLHISEETRDFYPHGDAGKPVLGGNEIWVSDEPILVNASELGDRARSLAEELSADLRTKIL